MQRNARECLLVEAEDNGATQNDKSEESDERSHVANKYKQILCFPCCVHSKKNVSRAQMVVKLPNVQ